ESSDCSRCRMCSLMTRVFPVPAPAITSSSPSPCVIARRCASLSFSPRSPSGSILNSVAMIQEEYRIFRGRGNRGYFPSVLLLPLRKLAGCYLAVEDRKSTRLNSSHVKISYAVFCLKKKKKKKKNYTP